MGITGIQAGRGGGEAVVDGAEHAKLDHQSPDQRLLNGNRARWTAKRLLPRLEKAKFGSGEALDLVDALFDAGVKLERIDTAIEVMRQRCGVLELDTDTDTERKYVNPARCKVNGPVDFPRMPDPREEWAWEKMEGEA